MVKPIIKCARTIVCEGNTVFIETDTTFDSNSSFFWMKNGKEILAQDPKSLTDTITEQSTYQLVVKGFCLTESNTITIDVAKKVGLTISTEDSVICQGDDVDVTFKPNEESRNGVNTYVEIKKENDLEFQRMKELGIITSNFSIQEINEPISIRLATNDDVCTDNTSNILQINVDKRNKEIMMDSQEICEGESTILQVKGISKSTEIVWITSEGDTISGAYTSASLSPTTTTTYIVTVRNGVCEDHATAEIAVHTKPTIISCDPISPNKFQLHVDAESYPLTYDYGRGPSESDTVTGLSIGWTYHIEVKDAAGCWDSLSFTVPVYDIEIPEYFVSDIETWRVKNMEIFGQSTYQIFDRHTKLLYEGRGTDEGWDGTYHGNKAPSTDYWYIIKIPEINKEFNGHFTLIRSK